MQYNHHIYIIIVWKIWVSTTLATNLQRFSVYQPSQSSLQFNTWT